MNLQTDKKRIIQGKARYEELVENLRIDSKYVILVLAGENELFDLMALENLAAYVRRKKAVGAYILCIDEKMFAISSQKKYDFPFIVSRITKTDAESIYEYYCFAFNIENITFTFLNHCHYNLMGRILKETDITEEEAVFLGTYWLRNIPEKKKYV